jgi:DNA-binding response OmpR family regulator
MLLGNPRGVGMADRLLIVEDDADLARALVRFLTRAGFEAQWVASCAEARSVKATFDLGVLDLQLPDGLGTNLCPVLLSQGTVSSVIFFTGTVNQVLLASAEELAPCVRKHEGIQVLLKVIRDALASAPRKCAAGDEPTPTPASPRGKPTT